MARQLPALFLLSALILCIGFSSRSEAETLITCSSPRTCDIFIFNSGSPQTLTAHTLALIPPQEDGQNISITGNDVMLTYDGGAVPVTCDGNWHSYGPMPEIANQYSCTVTSGGTAILITFRIYDQDVYNYPYDSSPAASVDPHLAGTSEGAPFCVTDNTVADASACKWEKQNSNDPILSARGVPLNDWVVYARTGVTDLKLSFEVTQDNSPYNPGDVICAADLDNNGSVNQTEIDYCLTTDISDKFLCPYELADCVFETKPPVCPAGSSFNPANNKCEMPWYCPPGGYTLIDKDGLCYSYSQITCLGGGSYWASIHRCVAGVICPPGYWFSSGDCACISSSFWCSAGSYNSSTHQCEAAPGSDNSCPSGFSYNDKADVCEGSPSCGSGGSFDPGTERCVTGASCPSGYGINCDESRCEAVPSCSDGSSFNTDTNRCETPSICPSGFTRSDHNCQADPICPPCDMVFNPGTHLCEGDQCPHNHDSVCYECVPMGGVRKCSPYSCYVYPHFDDTDTQQGANDKQDDGTVDSSGNCLGTIYIFNGKTWKCRSVDYLRGIGIDDGCCNKDKVLFGLINCDEKEKMLARLRDDDLCHKVGSYCAKRFLGLCIKKYDVYCCFHSKLGRIIQEQGRPQLDIDWGDAEDPNCRGFTPDEFQKLDFSKMDFSEFFEDIRHKAVEEVRGDVVKSATQKIQQFYK